MNDEIVNLFNFLIAEEITAALQYEIFAHRFRFYRFGKLAELTEEVRDQEMEHIQELTERALELNLNIVYRQSDSLVDLGTTYSEAIQRMTNLEATAIENYRNAISVIGKSDPTTKQLFKHILAEEESHKSEFAAECEKSILLGENDWLTTLVESKEPISYNKSILRALKKLR